MIQLKPIWVTLALVALGNASPIATNTTRPGSNTKNATEPASTPTESPTESPEPESTRKCDLDAFEPKSWAESGGEKMLAQWLDSNGPEEWLQGISENATGTTVAIDCAHTASNTCSAPPTVDCDNYEYYFVRLMASQVNAAFKNLQDKLQVKVIDDILNIPTIISDFDDVGNPPEGTTVTDTLNGIALGSSIISTIFGFLPGAGGVVSGIFGMVGDAVSTTAEQLEKKKKEPPEYKDLQRVMSERLSNFFKDTQSNLETTLQSIFGDPNLTAEEATANVRKTLGGMTGFGVKLDKNAKSPVSELLKGGEWLVPPQRSKIGDAMDKAFATTRQGLVGNLLATLQVYVEQEMPAYNEGLVQPCTALGTLKDGNSCLVIKKRAFDGSKARVPLEDKYLRLMGDSYGIDLHTLIRNVRDCNNGAVDTSKVLLDGSLPRCFFGLNFARRAHKKDVDFANGVSSSPCLSSYINQKGVPAWITDDGKHCDREIPQWKPCKVKFEELSYWTEGVLDRYRVGMIGENIDIAPICPYVNDGRRCAGGSNRQCYNNTELKKWVFDINFAKGSPGHNSYKGCMDDIRKKYAEDNRCQIA